MKRVVNKARPACSPAGERLSLRVPLFSGPQVDLVVVLAAVARALVRLHGAGHIHRDVKARNVLVRRAALRRSVALHALTSVLLR